MSDPRTPRRTIDERIRFIVKHSPGVNDADFAELIAGQFHERDADVQEACAKAVQAKLDHHSSECPIVACPYENALSNVLRAICAVKID